MTTQSTFPGAGALRETGKLCQLGIDVVRTTFRRPFQLREFIQQSWFIASVTILPTALVASRSVRSSRLQLGSLTKQIGAQSFTGAASVLAIIQQASPIVTALLIAGAGGSAICADLGSRTIREEIDAMEVLGVIADPAPGRAAGAGRDAGRPCCSTAWSASSACSAATSST